MGISKYDIIMSLSNDKLLLMTPQTEIGDKPNSVNINPE